MMIMIEIQYRADPGEFKGFHGTPSPLLPVTDP